MPEIENTASNDKHGQILARDHEQEIIFVEEREGRKYASLCGLWVPENGPQSDWYDLYDFPRDAYYPLHPVELLPDREYELRELDDFGTVQEWFADTSCLFYSDDEADMGYEAFLGGRHFEFAGWGSISVNSPCGWYLLYI